MKTSGLAVTDGEVANANLVHGPILPGDQRLVGLESRVADSGVWVNWPCW